MSMEQTPGQKRQRRQRRPKGTGSVRERSKGKWQLRVFAGTDPLTGKPRMHEKTVEASNKTKAQELLRDYQSELEQTGTIGTSATLAIVLAEWLRHSESRGRSPRTIHEARRIIDTVLDPELGHLPVAELSPHHLDLLYLKLSTGDGRPRPLSPASVRRYHAVLSAALGQAVKWGWIEKNPAERATPPALEETIIVVPTTDEVKRLLSAARARAPKWGMLLALALATGARRGELCALRWIDVDGDLIRIRRSLWRAGADRGEKGTKAGRERWVSVGPVAAQLLVDWREECEAAAAKIGTALVIDAFVVPSMADGSRPVNPDTLSSMVTKLCAELGMPHVHLHSLRHYAATELIGAGVNPRDAAEILGHADPALTLRVYTHGTRARQLEAAGVLELALIPAESS